jgi:endoglucanase
MNNIIYTIKTQSKKLCAIAIILAIGLSFAVSCQEEDEGKDKETSESPKISNIVINPKNATVHKGGHLDFEIKVNSRVSSSGTTKPPPQTVTIKINEADISADTKFGTLTSSSDSSTVRLTIGENENRVSITVTATSTIDKTKSAATTVSIIANPAPQEKQTFDDTLTATQLVAAIKIGWNLGNTFEAHDFDSWLSPATASVTQMETAWLPGTTSQKEAAVTKREHITTIKNAGFNAIRIPVTWYKAADSEYVIRSDWMRRITEVVNYAVAEDMYIILNSHHDETKYNFYTADRSGKLSLNESLAMFEALWTQIAHQFRNYDEKLIFEALNEPRTVGSQYQWSGGTAEERTNLNTFYQRFVNIVRESGGNNDKRILLINTYAASGTSQEAVDALAIPTDTASNKIIASVHSYIPNGFAFQRGSTYSAWDSTNTSHTSQIDTVLNRINTKFTTAGVPVIMGEFGAVNAVSRNAANADQRKDWADYYVSQARAKGIPCFWWDNFSINEAGTSAENFGLLDRIKNELEFPELIEAMMQAAEAE